MNTPLQDSCRLVTKSMLLQVVVCEHTFTIYMQTLVQVVLYAHNVNRFVQTDITNIMLQVVLHEHNPLQDMCKHYKLYCMNTSLQDLRKLS